VLVSVKEVFSLRCTKGLNEVALFTWKVKHERECVSLYPPTDLKKIRTVGAKTNS